MREAAGNNAKLTSHMPGDASKGKPLNSGTLLVLYRESSLLNTFTLFSQKAHLKKGILGFDHTLK